MNGIIHRLAAVAIALALASCGGESGGESGGDPENTGISIAAADRTVEVGGTLQITAAIAPPNAADRDKATWGSDDDGVATVSGAGLVATVVGVAPGTVGITVATKDGRFSASCEVTVTPAPVEGIPVTGVSLPNALTVRMGGAGSLAAAIAPADATNKNVSWKSDDPQVATVAGAGTLGTVLGVGLGSTTVTVSTEDGGFTDTCLVTVMEYAEPDVYVVGYEYDDGYDTVATLWKNLEPPVHFGTDSDASSIFVSGTGDVYVAGLEKVSEAYVATLWKNLEPPVHLGNGNMSNAYSVFVSGSGDVHVAGYETVGGYRVATLWKNDEPPVRLGGSETASYARSVSVSGAGDVYAAGYEYIRGVPADLATLWKNGEPPVRLAGAWSDAYSVFVSGSGDVYVAGYEYDGGASGASGAEVATLWKDDGPPVRLGTGSSDSYAYSVFASDQGDVYVAGYEKVNGWNVATLWKNLEPPVRLGEGSANSYAYSVFVSGSGDVYVAGEEYAGDGPPATLWKNGVAARLGASYGYAAYATSVFVK